MVLNCNAPRFFQNGIAAVSRHKMLRAWKLHFIWACIQFQTTNTPHCTECTEIEYAIGGNSNATKKKLFLHFKLIKSCWLLVFVFSLRDFRLIASSLFIQTTRTHIHHINTYVLFCRIFCSIHISSTKRQTTENEMKLSWFRPSVEYSLVRTMFLII